MANYIKPFATNPNASVMTNDELANADELKRGFIPKSKADSRLIGKLIQNSTAGAYVLGEFTSSVGGVDVDPSNATTFSSDFQNALKTYITRHAPQSDLSGYQLKTEAATQHQAISDKVAKKLDSTTASATYETKNNVTSKITEATEAIDAKLAGKANTTHTHTIGNVTNLQKTLDAKAGTTWAQGELAKKANLTNPVFTGTVKGTFSGNLTGNATSATKATQDGAGKVIATTYATKAELGSYATTDSVTSGLAGKQDKGEYVLAQTMNVELGRKANVSHTHATAQVTGLDAALAGKQNKGDYATNAAVNRKININGARGLIAGYESIGNHTTITNSSPDSNETAAAVTVNNGSANVCWTKIVHLTSASPSVNLGSSWKWQNGTSPELKQNGFLILCWCNTKGLAVYNNVQ